MNPTLAISLLFLSSAALGLAYPLTLGRVHPRREPGGGTFALGLLPAILGAHAASASIPTDVAILLLAGFVAALGHYVTLYLQQRVRGFGSLTDREQAGFFLIAALILSGSILTLCLPLFLTTALIQDNARAAQNALYTVVANGATYRHAKIVEQPHEARSNTLTMGKYGGSSTSSPAIFAWTVQDADGFQHIFTGNVSATPEAEVSTVAEANARHLASLERTLFQVRSVSHLLILAAALTAAVLGCICLQRGLQQARM